LKQIAKAYIEITDYCGLECDFCTPEKSKNKTDTMGLELFERIHNEINGVAKEVSYHILGDPLTAPNLSSYLDISLKYKIPVNITTSGFFLTPNNFATLTHPAIKQVNFSISSFFANKNIDTVDTYLGKIFDFCDFSAENPKRFINLRVWNIGNERYEKLNNVFFDRCRDRYGDLDFNTDKTKIAPYCLVVKDSMFEWPDFAKEKSNTGGRCYAISGQIGFLKNGDTVPCCLDSKGAMALGNIKHKSLSMLLNSQRAKNIVDGFSKGLLVEDFCKTCGFLGSRLG